VTPAAPEVLKFKEAAELLRCSDSVLLDGINDGTVPAFKLGHAWRFYRSDLMAIKPVRTASGEEAAPAAAVRAVAGKRGRG